MKAKAIETVYRDYRFRSRTEARYAVFLDHAGIEWEYEIQGYELPSGRYLPDFWLPTWQAWLEVKGPAPTEKEKSLCAELANGTDSVCILCSGEPGKIGALVYCSDSTDSSGGTDWWDMKFTTDQDGKTVRLDCGSVPKRTFLTPGWRSLAVPFIGWQGSARVFRHNLAFAAARRARFEHGETP